MNDIVVIGGGIVGLGIARECLNKGYKKVLVLEKEKTIASHQSSRNSGVMHSGLYYKPGSNKAKLCREGIHKIKSYCNKNNIKYDECGKLVVATSSEEIDRLHNLFSRGKENNLRGLQLLNKADCQKIEPNVNAIEGILVPEESIVDFKKVAESYLNDIKNAGGSIILESEVVDIKLENNYGLIKTQNGSNIKSKYIISASGLYSDLIAKMLGISLDNTKILPFRGEYYIFKKQFSKVVNNLIYPVPDPKLPFLGVHFTRLINGRVEAGPNAVLALSREGYKWRDINIMELSESLTYQGLRNFILKNPSITLGEFSRSLLKPIFVRSLQKLVPCVTSNMLIKGGSGVRAQLMNDDGSLEQDFKIIKNERVACLINAPSPAATSSLAIAKAMLEYLDI